MFKRILIKYDSSKYQSLSSGGWDCVLTMKIIWFWGLISYEKEIQYVIPEHANRRLYIENWDFLIENKKHIPKGE
jgi:hypothetical protein